MVSAANNNGFTKGGQVCAGTAFEIGEPFVLPPDWIIVDATGRGMAEIELEPGHCWVEALALRSCETSGATRVE